MTAQLIAQEDFTSVQQAQAGITRLFRKAAKAGKFYRVMRNQEPLGVIIPNNLWDSYLEDLEAISSPSYLKQIAIARKQKGGLTLEEIKKKYQIKA